MNTIETNQPITAPPELASPRSPPRGISTSIRIASSITTTVFAVIMTASGLAFVLGPTPVVQGIHHLGYPSYFTPLLGLAKLLGVAALVVPQARALREWAYAGFTVLFIAAILSHILSGDGTAHAAPATFVLGLLLASYFLRRRIAASGSEIRPVPLSGAAAGRFWRIAPWLSRLALLPLVVIFGAVSAKYLGNPVGVAAGLGISLTTPQAISTARIGFGAFPLGFAMFLAACLFSRRHLLVGLALATTVDVVATIVRALGISIDGPAAQSMRLLHTEIVLLVVLLAGLWIEISRRRQYRQA